MQASHYMLGPESAVLLKADVVISQSGEERQFNQLSNS